MQEYVVFLDESGSELLSFAPFDADGNGWARYFSPTFDETGTVILLRIGYLRPAASGRRWEEPGTPLAVREIHIATPGIGPQLLRDLPIARITAAVNRPETYKALTEHGRATPQMFMKVPKAGLWQSDKPDVIQPDPPVLEFEIEPGRQRRPDEFYAQVAAAFSWLSTRTQSPAQMLAEKNKVPVTTVHRWVKEARTRGLLTPATGRGTRAQREEGGE